MSDIISILAAHDQTRSTYNPVLSADFLELPELDHKRPTQFFDLGFALRYGSSLLPRRIDLISIL